MPDSKQQNYGTLYLIPTTLGKTPENNTIPDYVLRVIRKLDALVVENIQTARRFLQWVGDTVPEYEIEFFVLNKKTPAEEAATFIRPLLNGRDMGVISEAGCPGVADPGSFMVRQAHGRGVNVVPLVGPSSILLALMGSGFNGQNFAFSGYLPIDGGARKKAIQELETSSSRNNRTEIFMETPHRNNRMLKDILEVCRGDTRFCVAANLTLPNELIISKPVSEWKSGRRPDLDKQPAIFLLYAGKQ